MDTASSSDSSRAWEKNFQPREIKAADWIPHLDTLQRLYFTENRTLSEVRRILAQAGFYANEAQCKKKLGKLRSKRQRIGARKASPPKEGSSKVVLRKNIPKPKMIGIVRKEDERQAQGKLTTFSCYGRPIPQAKIDRFRRRMVTAEYETPPSPISAATPSDVGYDTPINSDTETPDSREESSSEGCKSSESRGTTISSMTLGYHSEYPDSSSASDRSPILAPDTRIVDAHVNPLPPAVDQSGKGDAFSAFTAARGALYTSLVGFGDGMIALENENRCTQPSSMLWMLEHDENTFQRPVAVHRDPEPIPTPPPPRPESYWESAESLRNDGLAALRSPAFNPTAVYTKPPPPLHALELPLINHQDPVELSMKFRRSGHRWRLGSDQSTYSGLWAIAANLSGSTLSSLMLRAGYEALFDHIGRRISGDVVMHVLDQPCSLSTFDCFFGCGGQNMTSEASKRFEQTLCTMDIDCMGLPLEPAAFAMVNHLALGLHDLGYHHTARQWLQWNHRNQRDTIGEQDPSALMTMHNIGLVLQELGDSSGAMWWYRRTLDMTDRGTPYRSYTRSSGARVANATMMNMAMLFYQQQLYSEAGTYALVAVWGIDPVQRSEASNGKKIAAMTAIMADCKRRGVVF